MLPTTRLLKTILIGNSNVGKTALIHRFVNEKYIEKYKSTIGADFMTKSLKVDKTDVTMQTWDTAGNERFMSLSIAFYRGADCCMLVFDVTNTRSFEKLTMWKDEFLKHADPPSPSRFPFVVVGNKCDCWAVVTRDDVEQWILQNDINAIYVETSALSGEGVNVAFEAAARGALAVEPVSISQDNAILQPLEDDDRDEKCCGW
ncbi:Sphingomyelin phosphodiesterase [Entamoeba marina]